MKDYKNKKNLSNIAESEYDQFENLLAGVELNDILDFPICPSMLSQLQDLAIYDIQTWGKLFNYLGFQFVNDFEDNPEYLEARLSTSYENGEEVDNLTIASTNKRIPPLFFEFKTVKGKEINDIQKVIDVLNANAVFKGASSLWPMDLSQFVQNLENNSQNLIPLLKVLSYKFFEKDCVAFEYIERTMDKVLLSLCEQQKDYEIGSHEYAKIQQKIDNLTNKYNAIVLKKQSQLATDDPDYGY